MILDVEMVKMEEKVREHITRNKRLLYYKLEAAIFLFKRVYSLQHLYHWKSTLNHYFLSALKPNRHLYNHNRLSQTQSYNNLPVVFLPFPVFRPVLLRHWLCCLYSWLLCWFVNPLTALVFFVGPPTSSPYMKGFRNRIWGGLSSWRYEQYAAQPIRPHYLWFFLHNATNRFPFCQNNIMYFNWIIWTKVFVARTDKRFKRWIIRRILDRYSDSSGCRTKA